MSSGGESSTSSADVRAAAAKDMELELYGWYGTYDFDSFLADAKAVPANTPLHVWIPFEKAEKEVGVTEDWEAFFQAAGNLTSLEWVFFHGYADLDQGRSASENQYARMQRLLELTRQIKGIAIVTHFDFHSIEDAVASNPFLHYLARGIENHPALEELELPPLYDNAVESLERFMPTLTTIPNLTKLKIFFRTVWDSETADDGSVGASFLRQLLTLPSLENVVIDDFQFRDEYSNIIEQALSQQTSKLRKLELYYCNMTMECFASLLRGISGRHSNLQELCLYYCRIGDYNSSRAAHLFDPLSGNSRLKRLDVMSLCGEEEEDMELPSFNSLSSFVSLCESLWKNCSVETLELEKLGDDHFGALVEMIRRNKGVKHLWLRRHRFSSQQLLEFAPALAQNTTLETLFLFPKSQESEYLEKKLDVIGKLNKFGRSYLVEDGRGPECRVAGVELLSAVSDDLDCLFYHLRENPIICDLELENAAVETASAPNDSGGLQVRFFGCCCWRQY